MDFWEFLRKNRTNAETLAWGKMSADEFREATNSPDLTDNFINAIVCEIWEPKGYISN
jgi:tRNA G10  N-methylase Trm11